MGLGCSILSGWFVIWNICSRTRSSKAAVCVDQRASTYPRAFFSLQESLLSEHQSLLSGNEAELETMIKDLRKELHGTQVRSANLLAFHLLLCLSLFAL